MFSSLDVLGVNLKNTERLMLFSMFLNIFTVGYKLILKIYEFPPEVSAFPLNFSFLSCLIFNSFEFIYKLFFLDLSNIPYINGIGEFN